MVLVFWQGIISIHQKSFLEAIAADPLVTEVCLFVSEDITSYRKDMGWEEPEITGVKITKAPSADQISAIVQEYKAAIHIMGGIKVDAMLSAAFDECVKWKCRLGIMTEPYNEAGIKGKLRYLKYRYYKLRYAGKIEFILAIGKQGVKQFEHLGFDRRSIFPWAYFISENVSKVLAAEKSSDQHIIYAGRLEEPKGIYRFVTELIASDAVNYKLDIYGTGSDEEKLKAVVTLHGLGDKIRVFPFLKHDNLLAKYAGYDWVVLPSTGKDGWGVIVSEGLLNGLKAICSSICGVSWVINEGENGLVIDWSDPHSCKTAIRKMLNEGSFLSSEEISSKAKRTISSAAGADYFLKIMAYLYQQKDKPGIPWVSN